MVKVFFSGCREVPLSMVDGIKEVFEVAAAVAPARMLFNPFCAGRSRAIDLLWSKDWEGLRVPFVCKEESSLLGRVAAMLLTSPNAVRFAAALSP